MRAWVMVVVVSLAGCSGDEPGGAPAQGLPSGTTGSGLAALNATEAPPVVVVTDTLHFQGPALTPVAPSGNEPVLVPLQSAFARAQQSDLNSHAMWTYEAKGGGAFSTVDVHLWLRIDRTLTNPYTVPGTCAWAVWFEVRDPDGQLMANHRPCVTDGPQVPAGDRELVFTLAGISGEVAAGSTVGLGLDVGPFDPAAPDAVQLLTGTPAFDSRMTLAGMAEPLP